MSLLHSHCAPKYRHKHTFKHKLKRKHKHLPVIVFPISVFALVVVSMFLCIYLFIYLLICSVGAAMLFTCPTSCVSAHACHFSYLLYCLECWHYVAGRQRKLGQMCAEASRVRRYVCAHTYLIFRNCS